MKWPRSLRASAWPTRSGTPTPPEYSRATGVTPTAYILVGGAFHETTHLFRWLVHSLCPVLAAGSAGAVPGPHHLDYFDPVPDRGHHLSRRVCALTRGPAAPGAHPSPSDHRLSAPPGLSSPGPRMSPMPSTCRIRFQTLHPLATARRNSSQL